MCNRKCAVASSCVVDFTNVHHKSKKKLPTYKATTNLIRYNKISWKSPYSQKDI